MRVENIKAIVTDIEGTTSSLSFVKDVLFPYARKHMAAYVRDHANDEQVAALLEDVRKEVGEPLSIEAVIEQLHEWIDQDKKVTPLKALQGMLWETGYKQGDFTGHIYTDAKQQLDAWHERGIALYVYSSGSIYAQKLLFGFTDYGDLNYLFTDNFDTTTGAKVDADSYRKIAEAIRLEPGNILFLSDIAAELDAAKAAGMQTLWLVRDGVVDTQATHVQVNSFSGIEI